MAPWPPGSPPPSSPHRRWGPALAIGLVCTLLVATAAGSLVIARLVASNFPAHAVDVPSTLPQTAPPQSVPQGVPSLSSLLTVLASTPTTPGVTVDPAQAARIVDTLWPVREQALDTDDVSTLAEFETGSALQGDTADLVAIACGCPAPRPRPIVTSNLFVPRQSSYPSWFISEVTTSPVEGSSPDVSLMVMTRASAQAPWMVSLETGYSFATGKAWVDATPASMTGGFDLPMAPRNELPKDLAAYYQHWADDGASPPTTPFASGVFTSAIGQTQVTLDKTLAAEGQVHHVVYSYDLVHDGDWAVAANNVEEQSSYGWALSCGTVRYEAVTTLAPGAQPIVQPPDLSTWGSTLPAGQYTKITQWGLHESCFLDDPYGIPYLVLGHNGGVVRSASVSAGGSV